MIKIFITNTWPNALCGAEESAKAAYPIKLMLTAFNISSMDINMRRALFRARTPYKPKQNNAALSI